MTASTVILAAGAFPRKGSAPWRLLESAARVVCCDSAADAYRRRFHRLPTAVVGDLDSLKGRPRGLRIVRVAEQETNDLDKAIRFCRQEGWTDLAIVGATGKREDHAIGNVFRALAADIPVVTETGVFHPVRRRATFAVAPGTPVSVFAPDPKTRMSSKGLAWPLEGVAFATLFAATLNRATGETVEVRTNRPVLVFISA